VRVDVRWRRPGADEDTQGEPLSVRRTVAQQYDQAMASGAKMSTLQHREVRPPGNRQPERDECETCSPFLMRQIATVKPKAIVALGANASKISWPSTHLCLNCAAAGTTSSLREAILCGPARASL